MISPLLANIALDGMERLFGCEGPNRSYIAPAKRKGENRGVSLIRYADDFIVAAPNKEILEQYVIPKLTQFLAGRGLKLNQEKTRIVHVQEGFNFLGFTIRRFKDKLLSKPQKEKVQRHLKQLKSILDNNKQATIEQIVKQLNPVIRGWANYYRHVAAEETFDYVGHRTWQMVWQWAKRRHPNKSSKWVKQRYFKRHNGWDWVFGNQAVTLFHPSRTPITRFTKVTGYYSPYDPLLRGYWEERTKRAVGRETYSQLRLDVLKRQNYRCYQCGHLFQPEQAIDLHHNIPRRQGGSDLEENRRALHDYCHHQLHQRHGYKVFKA